MTAREYRLPPALVLTDPERLPARQVPALDLPAGWGVIHRHFGRPERWGEAHRLCQYCHRKGLVFLVANDPSLASQVGADGVHWPERFADRARHWRGRFGLMTMSWHRARPVISPPAGIGAAIVSTVFPSGSPTAGHAMGPVRARTLALASDTPLYGLGGVTAANAEQIAAVMGLAGIEGFQCLTDT